MPEKKILLSLPPNPMRYGLLQGIAKWLRQFQSRWRLLVKPWAFHAALAFSDWDNCDGVILSQYFKSILDGAQQNGVPVVGAFARQDIKQLPRVVVDSLQVGCMAAEHLVGLGFRRFLTVGLRHAWFSDQRQDAFEHYLAEQGLSAERWQIDGSGGPEDWQRSVDGLAELVAGMETPLGAFACTDNNAAMLMDICGDLQLGVPEDVAVVGVDNFLEICNFTTPMISSVDPDFPQIGYRAAELLDGLTRGQGPPETPIIVPPKELVVRGSSDTLAIEDALVAEALAFIRRHADQPIRVGDVVESLPTSRRPLEIRFRKAVGRTLAEEIMSSHLHRARMLLVEGQMDLLDLALACGFRSQQHFSQAFKQQFGQTPSEFRRSHTS